MSRPTFSLLQDILDSTDGNDNLHEKVIQNIQEKTKQAVDDTKSRQTQLKSDFWIGKLKAESLSLGFGSNLLNLSARELNAVLSSYAISMTRNDGGDYEVSSVHNMFSLVTRYFKDNNYPFDIDLDAAFKGSREAKAAKVKKLKQKGMGNRPNRSESLTFDEEDALWEKGELGYSNPTAVLRTIWFYMTMMFGLRGRHEARQMMWGDVSLHSDESGRQYLKFQERLTKTRNGECNGRAFVPKAFGSMDGDSDRCPVKAYKEYAKRRPHTACGEKSPFFLAINHQRKEDSHAWFANAPLGINKLGSLLSTGCQSAGISGKKTNHSARKTAIQRTLDAGCPPAYVAQMSGHSSVVSLQSYTDATIDVQRAMSRSMLQGVPFEVQNNAKRQRTNSEEGASDKSHTMTSAPGQFVFNNCSHVTINMK